MVENIFDVHDYDFYDSHPQILGMDLFYSLSVLKISGIPFSQILRLPVPISWEFLFLNSHKSFLLTPDIHIRCIYRYTDTLYMCCICMCTQLAVLR